MEKDDQRETSSENQIQPLENDDRPDKLQDENGLTDKMEEFCLHYVQTWCKTTAAKRAGYSLRSSHTIGFELYQKPKIRARIHEILKGKRQEYAVTDMRLQTEIARMAFFDATEIFEEIKGRTLLMHDLKMMHPRHRAAIKTIKMGKYGLEIGFHDKTPALDMLAKHLGYYEKDNSQKKVEGVAIMLPDNGRGDADDILKINPDNG